LFSKQRLSTGSPFQEQTMCTTKYC